MVDAGWRIRPATPGDVPGVLPMVRRICAQHEAWDPERYAMLPDVVERYARWLPIRAANPRSVFLVAEREDAPPLVVGFLVATVEGSIPIYRLKEYGFIHDLWVEADYRNEGLARQLVMLAVERFGDIGVQQVRLDTAGPNDVARKLFERCGFRVSVVEMLREKDPK